MAEAIGGNAKKVVKDYVDKIDNLLEQIEVAKEKHIVPIREDIKDIYAAAKSQGFHVKSIRELVRKRRMDEADLEQLEVYEVALADISG